MSSKAKEKHPGKAQESKNTSESPARSTGRSTKASPSASISSPPTRLSAITKFFKTPRQDEKFEQTKSKSKKSTKKSIRGKEKSKNVEDTRSSNVSDITTKGSSSKTNSCAEVKQDTKTTQGREESLAEEGEQGSSSNTPGSRAKQRDNGKRTMIQTNLSTNKECIEVISSPEKPPAQKKKGKKASSKRKESHETAGKKQTKITSIFPVRKSSRKCKSEQEKDEQARITKAILSKIFEGLEGLAPLFMASVGAENKMIQVRTTAGKGRGVFACRDFERNEFVCEYSGELISYDEAKNREKMYSKDTDVGCYMYYLQFNNNKYCVDATAEDGTFGRLLNHSRTGNCKTKVHVIENTPHLIFVTKKDIKSGEELTYDYGDRSKDSLESHPWLKY